MAIAPNSTYTQAKQEFSNKTYTNPLKRLRGEFINGPTDIEEIYVSVTFSDDTTNTYVLGYDCTDMHSFLRCVSQEEWDAIMSGENLG